MLRGFRWQLMALVLACVLFMASLTTRLSTDTTPDLVTQTAQTTADSAPSATPESTVTPETPVTDGVDTVPASTEIVTFREGVVGTIQRINPLLAPVDSVDYEIASLIF